MCGPCAGAHADWADPQGDWRHHFSILQGQDRLQVQRARDGDALAQQIWLRPQYQEVQNEVSHSLHFPPFSLGCGFHFMYYLSVWGVEPVVTHQT